MKTMLMTGAALLFAGTLGTGTAFAADAAKAVDAGPVSANSQAMAAADQPDQAGHPLRMRQQIEAQLSRDGYTNVTVMPSSFFVHAKDKTGNPVAMVIGPDSFTEVTDLMPKQAANTPVTQPAAPAMKSTQQ